MNAVTHLEKVITGEVSAVTHFEKVIAGETSAVTYTEKVITGEAPPITHLQRVIAGVESPVTHLEYVWAGGSPTPTEHEYTGAVPYTFRADGTPLLDWYIKGNTVQNGTPTPDNPIMPQGTGERTGNLLPSPEAAIKSNNGITVRSDGAGRYYVSGTAENDAYITFNIPQFLIPTSVALDGNGTFSMFNTKTYQNDAVKLEFYYQGTFIDNWGLINLNRTSTNYSAMANKKIDTVGIFVKNGITVDFQISPEFTNDGVLPSEFEPYGYKIPIICGGTITTVYIGTNPLRKSLDGTAVDELSSNGTLTQRVDTDGSVLPTPIVSQIDTPTIPTVNGLNIFDVDTTVKPSEIYIKYKGV